MIPVIHSNYVYKLAMNTALANTRSLLLWRKQRIRFMCVSGYKIVANCSIYITLPYVMFLSKDTSFNIYHWLMDTELVANSTVTQAHLSSVCFLCRTPPSPLTLRNSKQHFNTNAWGCIKLWNHQQKVKKTWKKERVLEKDTFWELKQEGRMLFRLASART
jgi:hypothetical protein